MTDVPILCLSEPAGIDRDNEYVQVGIPLSSGQFFSAADIQLHAGDNVPLPSELTPTAYWADKSIRWCTLAFHISLRANQSKNIFLRSSPVATNPDDRQTTFEESNFLGVATKGYRFLIDTNNLSFVERISNDDSVLVENGFCSLETDDETPSTAIVKSLSVRTARSETGPLYTDVDVEGQFTRESGILVANVSAKLRFFFETDSVEFSVTLHNPLRASHPGGMWDLGDRNSIRIRSFSIGFDVPGRTNLMWKMDEHRDWCSSDGSEISVYQESSGGENWDSPNHKNAHNDVPLRRKGYLCTSPLGNETGARASPTLCVAADAEHLSVSIDKFWQNFPKALAIVGNTVRIGLFPGEYPDTIELQPGERKTHRFCLNIGNRAHAFPQLSHPIVKNLDPNWLERCKAWPFFPAAEEDDPLQTVIQEGLTGSSNFFRKREALDEYGWRNYGELYADHEADFYEGSDIFVSHYNNQYDPIHGFLRQFASTGDGRWFELADDLCKHVKDIDIYHTELDKEEYNGGLFWHTDHYLNAGTATHRTYSSTHTNRAYGNHQGGGGPSGQHCYTSGLLLHYLMTGSESSRLAVFQLTDWIGRFYEGSGRLADLLLRLKTRNRIGAKNIVTGQYPLDRGTGNYVNSLLDCYYLTRDHETLTNVEHIIENTIHPLDDLESQHLGDAENNWFYTVFLQSVCRYLHVKEELSALDSHFYFARDALLTYADWMLEHENPYLQNPSILEFPNHTWTAQDMRKIGLLLEAGYFGDDRQADYLETAQGIYAYVAASLENEPTRTYTRILALLMQNFVPVAALDQVPAVDRFGPRRSYDRVDRSSAIRSVINVGKELARALRGFSIRREIEWLRIRSEQA